jgi:hypothetical protein
MKIKLKIKVADAGYIIQALSEIFFNENYSSIYRLMARTCAIKIRNTSQAANEAARREFTFNQPMEHAQLLYSAIHLSPYLAHYTADVPQKVASFMAINKSSIL